MQGAFAPQNMFRINYSAVNKDSRTILNNLSGFSLVVMPRTSLAGLPSRATALPYGKYDQEWVITLLPMKLYFIMY